MPASNQIFLVAAGPLRVGGPLTWSWRRHAAHGVRRRRCGLRRAPSAPSIASSRVIASYQMPRHADRDVGHREHLAPETRCPWAPRAFPCTPGSAPSSPDINRLCTLWISDNRQQAVHDLTTLGAPPGRLEVVLRINRGHVVPTDRPGWLTCAPAEPEARASTQAPRASHGSRSAALGAAVACVSN
jgi:hypothetical protein